MIGNTRRVPALPSPRAASRRGALQALTAGFGAVLLRSQADRLAAQSNPATPAPGSPSLPNGLPYLSTYPGMAVLPPDSRLSARPLKLREAVKAVTDRTIQGPGSLLPLRLY